MLRLMGMRLWLVSSGIFIAVLAAGCTAGQPSAKPRSGPEASATSSTASSRASARVVCAKAFPTVRAAQDSTAGALRWFGPRAMGSPGNFAGLADSAGVTLCLVADGKGLFDVYGVPVATGRAQRLWTQGGDSSFTWPM